MTTTVTKTDDQLEQLRAARRVAAYAASQGEKGAEAKLKQIEAQIIEATTAQERAELATEHAAVVNAEVEQRTQARKQKELEQRHGELMPDRRRVLADIQEATDQLASLILEATALDDEIHNVADELGWGSERPIKYRIENYITWKLGKLGAGLPDMNIPWPQLRIPLITEGNK
jgi:hypothetical protein